MKRVNQFVTFIVFIITWYIASCYVNHLFIPSPVSVIKGIGDLFNTGQLLNGAIYSFTRVTVASLLSAILSLVVGLLIYSFKPIEDLLYPIVKMLRYVPVTAFYPLLIMWCGIGENMKVTFLFIVTFVSMMPSVILAFSEVSDDLMDTGQTIGMNKFQRIKMVLLPASLPSIMENFILLLSIGWTYIPYVETINAKYGLGYIIYQSSARGRTDLLFSSLIIIILISVFLDKSMNLILKRVFRWKYLKEE